jgi:hypothetical protein
MKITEGRRGAERGNREMGKWDCRTCPVGHTSDFDRQRDSRCWGCGNYEQPPAERLGLVKSAHRLPPSAPCVRWRNGHRASRKRA